MRFLVVLISSGKGTWSEPASIINKGDWENVFLVVNEFTKDKFTISKKHDLIVIDERDFKGSIDKLKSSFSKIDDVEVALNITSGSGREHMMVIQALMKAGLSFKFVVHENKKLKVLDPFENEILMDYENLI